MLDPGSTVLSGQLLLSLPIALAAGVVSFLSPCVLPLVPGYFGLLGSLGDGAAASRRRLLAGVALFIAGFALVFVLANAIVGAASIFLLQYGNLLTRILGVLLIVMGLVFVGQFSFLQRVWKPAHVRKGGLWGAPLVGIVFALGWTPCMGPTLAAIGTLTVTSGSAWQGALLGLVYALGLGIPFLLIALGFGWMSRSVAWVKRYMRAVNIAGGVLLMLMGALMVTGVWTTIMNEMQGWFLSVPAIL